MNDIQVVALEEARSRVWELSQRGCYGNSPDDDPSNCGCDVCEAQRVLTLIDRTLVPPIEGLHPQRMMNGPERIFVEHFRKQCERSPGLNGGAGLLELILRPSDAKCIPHVSHRDAQVATTVIQWLGTNCGQCFIEEAERLIKEAHARRCDFGTDGLRSTAELWKEEQEKNALWKAANQVACSFLSTDSNAKGVEYLRKAIITTVIGFMAAQRQKFIDTLKQQAREDSNEG